jgi:hypothetical protein
MIGYKDYVAGWLESSIHDFVQSFPRSSRKLNYCLITCLDSNTEPKQLLETSPELRPYTSRAEVIGEGILLSTNDLLNIYSENRIFFGFDEVWFFPSKSISLKPSLASIVGPSRINQALMDTLGIWMAENSCSLALGDGTGLNLILKARGLVRYVIGNSIDQEC